MQKIVIGFAASSTILQDVEGAETLTIVLCVMGLSCAEHIR